MIEAASFPVKPFTKMVGGSRKVHPIVVRWTSPFCWKMEKTLHLMRVRCRNTEFLFQKNGGKTFQFRCCNDGKYDSKGFDGSVGMKKKLAVFVSGGGSNFRSIHEATLQGFINGEVTALVTDKPGCGGAKYAAENGIPLLIFPKTKSSIDGLSQLELVSSLRKLKVDFVLLAGYLKLIPNELVRAFPKSILNIHPSLLPAFGGKGFFGLKVHQAVIESGARMGNA
ncbi:Methionyl-tRNA formyltransferase [Zostera marina]|uniref:phosphoribosylglycinamide formyltransferase 1 n=1 Tax=Zostera marina TaxID=29655 RepID=A0A0K9PAC2_ZOSMR|nr:Methionyl-tRNA formyltransferase [Zostera marina]